MGGLEMAMHMADPLGCGGKSHSGVGDVHGR